MDEHIIEAMGKTKIIIKDGKVVYVGKPQINYCPLFDKYRGIHRLNSSSIKKNMQFRIDDFGMCRKDRVLKMHDFLSFGISETLGTLLDDKIIDCAVVVCEGCGTVIVKDSVLVQGMGGRISGILSTTPIQEIIDASGFQNVLNAKTAEINQTKGFIKAIKLGYKNIAVTITSAKEAENLRKIEKENKGINIYIFIVHTSGISKEDAETFFQHADIITGCASKYIREIGDERNIFKAGVSIPIYAATKNGVDFLQRRIKKIGGLKEKKQTKIPEPLI
jgi:putative methanogenesis marker protein 8